VYSLCPRFFYSGLFCFTVPGTKGQVAVYKEQIKTPGDSLVIGHRFTGSDYKLYSLLFPGQFDKLFKPLAYFRNKHRRRPVVSYRIHHLTVTVQSISFLVYLPAVFLFQWIMIGNLIQFQASKIVLYISCFSVGVYAFSKEWFFD
jgi:hypothetical protein